VIAEAIAISHRQKPGAILGSIAHTFIAETVGSFQSVSPVLLEHLTSLLDWPHWETRLKAIQALGQIRRAIPDAAIRRLLELRLGARSPLIRNAADKALAEILSLETGIEDDEEAC
jgi:HEAT repeat protein